MHISEFKKLVTSELGSYADENSGGILYSAIHTINKGDLYYLGYNPGGEGGISITDKITHINEHDLKASDYDEFYDGEWVDEPGEASLQRRTKLLFHAIGYSLKDTLTTNLIFKNTPRSADKRIDHWIDGETCWKLHVKLLEIVQPKVILVNGIGENNSAYSFLRDKLGAKNIQKEKAGHGTWQFKTFETKINDRKTYILAIPHMSFYSPDIEKLTWFIEKIKTYTGN